MKFKFNQTFPTFFVNFKEFIDLERINNSTCSKLTKIIRFLNHWWCDCVCVLLSLDSIENLIKTAGKRKMLREREDWKLSWNHNNCKRYTILYNQFANGTARHFPNYMGKRLSLFSNQSILEIEFEVMFKVQLIFTLASVCNDKCTCVNSLASSTTSSWANISPILAVLSLFSLHNWGRSLIAWRRI